MIHTRTATPVALGALSILLIGNVQGPVHRFEKSTQDGVEIVTNTGAPKYDGELFTYKKILTIEPTEEEALLSRPIQFLSDGQGRYYVYDPGRGTILVFDAEGTLLNSIGRKGEGPGEFNACRVMSVWGGTVTIFQSILQRVQRFRSDGSLIDVISMEPKAAMLSALEAHILGNGNHLSIRGVQDEASPGEKIGIRVLLTDAEGDPLLDVSGPQIRVAQRVPMSISGRTAAIPMQILFGPYPAAHFAPSQGIVMSPGDAADLHVYSVDGRYLRKIHVDIPQESVRVEDRDAARSIIERRMDGATEQIRSVLAEQLKRLVFADTRAPWTQFEVDPAGYFWLQMPLPRPVTYAGWDGQETIPFRVLSPEGEYLGITHRPNGSFSMVSHGQMLVLETDPETGLDIPTVYAIHPAVQGLKYP